MSHPFWIQDMTGFLVALVNTYQDESEQLQLDEVKKELLENVVFL